MLPKDFRKRPVRERRAILDGLLGDESSSSLDAEGILDLSDVMVESAVGTMAVPIGIAAGFLVNGSEFAVPIAVEEPSVVAAATYAAGVVRSAGGFEAWSTEPVMTAQIPVVGASPEARRHLDASKDRIAKVMEPALKGMIDRGGGVRDIRFREIAEAEFLVVEADIDTRDAMGANIVNTAAEAARGLVEEISGGSVLMAILTNASPQRRSGARFRIPVPSLRRGGRDGATMAARIVRANQFASLDFDRAVTHNKGIMNGIASVALATGNDTRAVEAAAHAWAARGGRYQSLTSYHVESSEAGTVLVGELELPMALATVGGAASIHPTARESRAVLSLGLGRFINAGELGQVAVSLGLAQNLAALMALVNEGIQGGHMRLHARRLAFQAGARGASIEAVAEGLATAGVYNLETAKQILLELHA